MQIETSLVEEGGALKSSPASPNHALLPVSSHLPRRQEKKPVERPRAKSWAGLPLPGDCKGVESIAAHMQQVHLEAAHQCELYHVAKANSPDDTVRTLVLALALFDNQRHGLGAANRACFRLDNPGPQSKDFLMSKQGWEQTSVVLNCPSALSPEKT
jgi:hypothetical protein